MEIMNKKYYVLGLKYFICLVVFSIPVISYGDCQIGKKCTFNAQTEMKISKTPKWFDISCSVKALKPWPYVRIGAYGNKYIERHGLYCAGSYFDQIDQKGKDFKLTTCHTGRDPNYLIVETTGDTEIICNKLN